MLLRLWQDQQFSYHFMLGHIQRHSPATFLSLKSAYCHSCPMFWAFLVPEDGGILGLGHDCKWCTKMVAGWGLLRAECFLQWRIRNGACYLSVSSQVPSLPQVPTSQASEFINRTPRKPENWLRQKQTSKSYSNVILIW